MEANPFLEDDGPNPFLVDEPPKPKYRLKGGTISNVTLEPTAAPPDAPDAPGLMGTTGLDPAGPADLGHVADVAMGRAPLVPSIDTGNGISDVLTNAPGSALNMGAGLLSMGGRAVAAPLAQMGAGVATMAGQPQAADAMQGFAKEQFDQLAGETAGLVSDSLKLPASMTEPFVSQLLPHVGEWMRANGVSGEEFLARFRNDPVGTLAMVVPAAELAGHAAMPAARPPTAQWPTAEPGPYVDPMAAQPSPAPTPEPPPVAPMAPPQPPAPIPTPEPTPVAPLAPTVAPGAAGPTFRGVTTSAKGKILDQWDLPAGFAPEIASRNAVTGDTLRSAGYDISPTPEQLTGTLQDNLRKSGKAPSIKAPEPRAEINPFVEPADRRTGPTSRREEFQAMRDGMWARTDLTQAEKAFVDERLRSRFNTATPEGIDSLVAEAKQSALTQAAGAPDIPPPPEANPPDTPNEHGAPTPAPEPHQDATAYAEQVAAHIEGGRWAESEKLWDATPPAIKGKVDEILKGWYGPAGTRLDVAGPKPRYRAKQGLAPGEKLVRSRRKVGAPNDQVGADPRAILRWVTENTEGLKPTAEAKALAANHGAVGLVKKGGADFDRIGEHLEAQFPAMFPEPGSGFDWLSEQAGGVNHAAIEGDRAARTALADAEAGRSSGGAAPKNWAPFVPDEEPPFMPKKRTPLPGERALPGFEDAVDARKQHDAGVDELAQQDAIIEAKRRAMERTGQTSMFDDEGNRRVAKEKASKVEDARVRKSQGGMFEEDPGMPRFHADEFSSLEEARDALSDDRSHGDDYLGAAADRLFRQKYGKDSSTWPKGSEEEIAAMVDRVQRRAEMDRASAEATEDPGMPAGGPPTTTGATQPPASGRAARWFSSKPAAVARRMDIVRELEKAITAPMRRGIEGERSALGFWKRESRVGRARELTDIPTVAHEAGHALQHLLFPESPDYGGFEPRGRNSSVFRRELQAMGKALYGNKKPVGGYKSEGLAEFVRLWVTDREQAKAQAPAFAAEFERRLATDETTEAAARHLDAAARLHEIIETGDDVAYVQQHIVAERPAGEKAPVLDRIKGNWYNNLNFVERMETRTSGRRHRTELASPYSVMDVGRNIDNRAHLAIERSGKAGEFTGIYEDRPNFLLADVEELNLDNPEVRAGKDPLGPTRAKKQSLEDRSLASRWQKHENNGFVESGGGKYFLTEKGVAELGRLPERVSASMEDILAPVATKGGDLQRFENFMVAVRADELHKAGIKTGLDPKRTRGAIAKIDSPEYRKALEGLVHFQNMLTMNLAHAGVIPKALAHRVIEKWPWYVPFQRVMHDALDATKDGAGTYRVKQPIRKIFGSGQEVLSPLRVIVENVHTYTAIAQRNLGREMLARWGEHHIGSGIDIEPRAPRTKVTAVKLSDIAEQLQAEIPGLDLSGADLDAVLKVFRKEAWTSKSEGALTWFRRGEERTLMVRPKELFDQVVGADAQEAHTIMKALEVPNDILRTMVVLDPRFWLWSNPLVDAFTTSVFARIPGVGYRLGYDLARGVKSTISKDRWYAAARTDGALANSLFSRGKEHAVDDAMRRFTRKTPKEKVGEYARRPWRVAGDTMRTMHRLLEAIDNANRVGVTRRWLEVSGTTRAEMYRAAAEAREAPGYLSRGGKKLHSVNRVVAFTRPAVSGLGTFAERHAEALRDPSVGVPMAAKIFAYVIAPSIAVWALNYLYDKGQSQREDYDRNRDTNWQIPDWKGGKIKIRKPRELGVLYGSSVERLLDYAATGNPEWGKGYASSVVAQFTPNLLMTAIEPLIENARNRTYYFDRPVESQADQDVDAVDRWGPSTSDTAKAVAALLRRTKSITGDLAGEAVSFGKTEDISPKKVDNIFWSWASGIGTTVLLPTSDAILRQTLGRTQLGRDLGVYADAKPTVGGSKFMSRVYASEERAGGGLVERFYGRIEASQKAFDTWKARVKSGRNDEADSYIREHANEINEHVILPAVKDRLDLYGSMLKDAYARGDQDELKKIRRDRIEYLRAVEGDIETAKKDPTWEKAARYDAELSRLRAEDEARRLPISAAIEGLVDKGDAAALFDFVAGLPAEDRDWAKAYKTRYQKVKGKNAIEKAVEKAPKKYRAKLAGKVGVE